MNLKATLLLGIITLTNSTHLYFLNNVFSRRTILASSSINIPLISQNSLNFKYKGLHEKIVNENIINEKKDYYAEWTFYGLAPHQ